MTERSDFNKHIILGEHKNNNKCGKLNLRSIEVLLIF